MPEPKTPFAKIHGVGDGAGDLACRRQAYGAGQWRCLAVSLLIEDAVQSGGKIVSGGKRVANKGHFLEPTVLLDVPKQARAMNEEPFGPVAMINRFRDFDEAVSEANRLSYGLAAYAYTRSVKNATAVAASVEAGMLSINHYGLGLAEVPFGGIKDSGYGSEGGPEAIESYRATKFVFQASPV